MDELHSLLKRQLRRFAVNGSLSEEQTDLLRAVNEAYWQFDADRRMLEHSLELTSQELVERNVELSRINAELEQRVAERTSELSGSEARFRGLFEHAPVSIWEEDFSAARQYIDDLRLAGVVDFPAYFDAHPEAVAENAKQVKVVDVNRTTLEIYQAESKAQLLAGLSKVLGPESFVPFKGQLLALARGETSFESETINYTLRGERRVIFLRLTVAPGSEETWARVFVGISDITRRRQAENALAAERDLLQALMDNIPDTIYFKDAASRFTRINGAQAKMLGVTAPEAAIGKTDFDFFQNAKLAQSFFEEEQRIIETGEPLINRVEFNPTKEGEPRWLTATKVPIKDSSERVIGIVGVSRDITQRMHVEEALREAELKYRTLVEYMPVIIYVDLADESRNTVYISPQIQEMLGYSPEDWIAKPDFCNTIIHPEDSERMWKAAQESEAHGRFACDYRYIAKDGRVVWVHDEAVLLKNEAGAPSVWQGVMLDITAQKEAETALSEGEQRYRALFESAQRQAQELALLDRVRQALAREMELPLILRTVVEAIAQTFGYTLVSLYLVDGDELALQHQVGYDHVIERIPLMQGVAGQVVRSQQPMLLEDVSNDPTFLEAIEGITSEVCVPLFDQGQVAGILNVESTQGVRLSDADLRLMIALGEQIGIALGRARLYSDVRESEQRFRQLAENIEQVFWLEDPKRSHLFYISPAYEVIWGRTRQSLYEQPQSWFDAIHPDDRERALAAQVRKASGEYDIEYRVIRPDGSLSWVWSRAFPIQDQHGQVYRIAGIAEDITARKQAEEGLRQNEERFRLMAWATQDAVWDWDLKMDQIWWGEGLQKISHYESDTTQTNPAWRLDHIHPEDRAKVNHIIDRALDGGMEFWSKEYRFQRVDGTFANVMDRGYIIRNDAGKPYRMIGAMMDITERKQAEQALLESEARYRQIVETAGDIIYGVDLRGHLTYVNPTAMRIMQFNSEEEILGRQYLEFAHPAWRKRVKYAYSRQFEEKTLNTYHEFLALTRERQEIWLGQTVQLVMENNRVTGFQAVARDITAQKQAEAALQDLNGKMVQSLSQLERRNSEIALLNELSRLLQACQSTQEAYRIIADLMDQLFPRTSGALYLLNPSRTLASAISSWGDLPAAERRFAPDDCWALRRGLTQLLSEDQAELRCLHLSDPPPEVSYCLTMHAQNEILGVLHVQSMDKGNLDYLKHQLAYTVVEQTGMALSNLRLRDALREQSIRDPLTGLYNRRYMEEALKQHLSRVTRQLHPLGLIMLDIDHFKLINDTYGHSAGDALLIELGRLLKGHIRSEDIACRYGGEEFIVIMPDASLEATQVRAELLRQAAKTLGVQDGGPSDGRITLSLGVAVYPQHGRNMDRVLRAADDALYEAKRAGRDQVVCASPGG